LSIYKRFIILLTVYFVSACLTGKLLAEEEKRPALKESTATAEKYPDMVLIPAGEFTMGDNTRYNCTFMLAYNIYDGPEHVVYLDVYYIDKY